MALKGFGIYIRGWWRRFVSSFKTNEHRSTDLLISLVSFSLLAAMSQIVLNEPIPQWEITTFRAINDLPSWMFYIIWPFMQYGVFVTIPIVATIAFYFKKYRLATLLLLGGVGIYYAARVVKELVPRGRPTDLLMNVEAYENTAPGSSGYTSGHTAVASTIATFAHHYLSNRWKAISIFTLIVVAIGRVYVGAHLPLDVLGGIALGTGVASLVSFIVGVPSHVKVKEDTKQWVSVHRPRHPGDVIRAFIAVFVVALTTFLAYNKQLGLVEEAVFHVINYLPSFLSPLLVFIMQGGALFFVFIAAPIALLVKHRRLAVKILFGGVGGWWLARVMKELIQRERPGFLVADIVDRAQASGLGFPSGHSTVAAVIATVVVPYVPKRWRKIIWVLAWTVAISRVYVGAHLPLDIFGGLALGWLIGSLLNLGFGTPAKPVPLANIKQRLVETKLGAKMLHTLELDARGSTPLMAKTDTGKSVFIKLFDSEHRNADILYRLWRYITLREVQDEAPFASPKQIAEHEAYVSIQAAQSGVRVPKVLLATTVTGHSAMIVNQYVNGKILTDFKGTVDERLLVSIWKEVAKLHEGRIAHRDLRASNIMIDRQRRPWLIDFSFASTAATDRQLQHDVIELLASTALLTNSKLATSAAIKAMGKNTVKQILPYIHPMSITSSTRKRFRHDQPKLLLELTKEVQRQTKSGPIRKAQVTRFNYRWMILVAIIGLSLYYLLPRLGELESSLAALEGANIPWLLAAAGASLATYMMSALVVVGSTLKPLAYGSILLLQAATTAVNRITPKGIGGITLTEQYLERKGLKRAEATASVSIIYGSGALMHFILLLATVLLVDFGNVQLFSLTSTQLILVIAIGALVLLGVVLIPRLNSLLKSWYRELGKNLRGGVHHPVKLLQLFGGSAGITIAYAFGLYCSLQAFGAALSFGLVLLIYLAGNVVAAAAPTPGGLGAAEAALAVGISAAGVSLGVAVTAVLVFRLITFWLPILPGFWAFRRVERSMYA